MDDYQTSETWTTDTPRDVGEELSALRDAWAWAIASTPCDYAVELRAGQVTA